jgi:hypothetical protein
LMGHNKTTTNQQQAHLTLFSFCQTPPHPPSTPSPPVGGCNARKVPCDVLSTSTSCRLPSHSSTTRRAPSTAGEYASASEACGRRSDVNTALDTPSMRKTRRPTDAAHDARVGCHATHTTPDVSDASALPPPPPPPAAPSLPPGRFTQGAVAPRKKTKNNSEESRQFFLVGI